jgi:tRNA(Ile2) C34 agmatinyltransferase TiaS
VAIRKSNSDNALSATEQHRKLKETIEERWENARKMIAEAARSADEHHFLTQQKLDVSQIAMANIKAVATESEFKIQGTHSIVEQIKEQTNK